MKSKGTCSVLRVEDEYDFIDAEQGKFYRPIEELDISIYLDQETKQVINDTTKDLGVTKSELIRKSISEYLKKLKQPSAWEIGKDVFGKYSSGFEYLSSKRKKLVKNKIETKRQ